MKRLGERLILTSLRAMAGIGLSAALALTGCASTKQPRGPVALEVKGSGFLGDLYSQMKEGEKGEELLVYCNPRTETLASDAYDKAMIDSVKIYYGPESKMKDIPEKQLQAFADLFSGKLAESLSNDYTLVSEPGPRTLRVQVAITDVKRARTALKVLSFVPWGVPVLKFAILKSKEELTGKPIFQGEATAEAKIEDAVTGEVLWASVDRRVGKRTTGGWKSWTDAEMAFEYWAKDIRYRLCTQVRHGKECVSPGK